MKGPLRDRTLHCWLTYRAFAPQDNSKGSRLRRSPRLIKNMGVSTGNKEFDLEVSLLNSLCASIPLVSVSLLLAEQISPLAERVSNFSGEKRFHIEIEKERLKLSEEKQFGSPLCGFSLDPRNGTSEADDAEILLCTTICPDLMTSMGAFARARAHTHTHTHTLSGDGPLFYLELPSCRERLTF